MSRIRHRMVISTSPRISSGEWRIDSISPDDISQLGALTYDAYNGTIDYEGETREQSEQLMKETLEGKYGAFVDSCSFRISLDGRLVSATLVTMWQGKPLLSFAMTHPDYQGKGMARSLIEKSITALTQEGQPELRLVVTEGNPAQRLYESIGFVICHPERSEGSSQAAT